MKRQYPVIDSDSALRDYNKKFVGFQDILGRIKPTAQEQPIEPQLPSLSDHLLSQGEPTYFTRRLAMAKKMGMSNYTGDKEQDQSIYNALQVKNQNDQESDRNKMEKITKDREFSLKKKEFGLKERELEKSKLPTSDELASSIIKNIG